MVISDDRATTPDGRPADDRGQLILVGALAIALVLFGLVVLVNATVFAGTVGSYGTVETVKEGGTASLEIERGIAATASSVNTAERYESPGDVSTAIEDNVSALDLPLATHNADAAGTHVAIDDVTADDDANRTTQDVPANFSSASGDDSWEPINATAAGPDDVDAVGAFTVEINATGTGDSLEITINGSEDDTTITLTDEDGEVDLDLDEGETSCTIDATGGWVVVDVADGSVAFSDCEFAPLAGIDDVERIEFDSAGDIQGTYDIVVDGTIDDDDRFTTDADELDAPYRSAAIWSVTVDYVFDTEDVTVETTDREVKLYP